MSDPRVRHVLAKVLLVATLVGWPATHVLIVVTKPAEASWVFHLLLALSWLGLTIASLGILAATDIRQVQHENDKS